MCGKSSEFDRVCESVRGARSLLWITHARPDGDAIGCVTALHRCAQVAGRRSAILVPDAIPQRYAWLLEGITAGSAADLPAMADAADLIVIVDTSAYSQLDGLRDGLAARRDKIAVVDHHATREDVAAIQWVDTSAAAAGVMVTELIEALSWPVPKPVAEALAMAVTTDTGWLRFANTDSRCLGVMGRLIDAGVRPDELYARIFQADRPQRLALLAVALGSMRLHCGGKLAAMVLRRADFSATGALPEETENLVNEPLRAGTIESSILLVEQSDCIRVSLRSRGAVDVAKIAGIFGGGGHTRAAGLRATGEIESLREKIVGEFEKAF